MAHQADVHILVRATLEEDDLAGTAFLGGGAEQHDPARQIVLDQCSPEGECHAHARDCDQVVPAGVPDPRQRVHFRVEPQCLQGRIRSGRGRRGGVGKRRAPGCREVLVVLLDFEAVVLHEPCEGIVGVADFAMIG